MSENRGRSRAVRLAAGLVTSLVSLATIGESAAAITLPVGIQGCGGLYRKSTTSNNAYLYGCGTKFDGHVYRVPFNGYNLYYCFSYYGSKYVGSQTDLAGQWAQLQDTPATKWWCDNKYPSRSPSGG